MESVGNDLRDTGISEYSVKLVIGMFVIFRDCCFFGVRSWSLQLVFKTIKNG